MMVTLDEARDLAARGFGSVDTEIYAPDPSKGPYQYHVRTRTVGEVTDELREILGEYPEGAEEYITLSDRYTCYTPGCGHLKYGQHNTTWDGHYNDGDGACRRNGCSCAQFMGTRDREWPQGRIVCFPVRGGSEGQYTHLSVIRSDNGQEDLILLCKSLREGIDGRNAAWSFARSVADLLGI